MANLLYNLTEEEVRISQMIDEADGEITPEIEKLLDIHEANELGRVMTMKTLYTLMSDKAKLAKEKKEHFYKLQKQWESGSDNLKRYITDYMVAHNKKKFEYETESISKRKTPNKVVIDDVEAIPAMYKKYTVTLTEAQYINLKTDCEFSDVPVPEAKIDVDKKKIMEDYKASKVEVSGTHIESGFTVTIKG